MRRRSGAWATAAAGAIMLAALAACATSPRDEPPPSAPQPPQPPPPAAPPPIDLGGRWKLTAAAGGACFMTLGDAPGAVQGTIAPEGGCPDNFYMSRKWSFDHDALVIRDHKGNALGQLSFTDGHFEGQDGSGATLTLSR